MENRWIGGEFSVEFHISTKGNVTQATMIEHKAGEPEKLVSLLRRMNLIEEVLVQSFDWAWLERV